MSDVRLWHSLKLFVLILAIISGLSGSTLIQEYKHITERIMLMEEKNEASSGERGSSFTKGMTLSEYMSQLHLENEDDNQETYLEKQQNLYLYQTNNPTRNCKRSKDHYEIRQIDEESHEDSVDYQNDQFAKKIAKEQLTKETFRETNYFDNSPAGSNAKPTMNATAYFNPSAEKNSFRVKHLSNSPYKKKQETIVGATMTLYGRKFFKSIGKEANKIPELATFYGKLKQKTQQKPAKGEAKQVGVKHNFKKKNQLQLDDLIKFEQKIKSNYSQKIYFQDIRIQGIKDKICERKNKLY